MTDSRNYIKYNQNLLINYNINSKEFEYPSNINEVFSAKFDKRPLWQILKEDQLSTQDIPDHLEKKLQEFTDERKDDVYFVDTLLKLKDETWKWFRIGFISAAKSSNIHITITDITLELAQKDKKCAVSPYDELTGLFTKSAFCHVVNTISKNEIDKIKAGKFALIYFDVLKFKGVNDVFGIEGGNLLLKHIADIIMRLSQPKGVGCRIDSDRFVIFIEKEKDELEKFVHQLLDEVADYGLSFKVSINIGIYVTTDQIIPAASMIDRAVLAQSTIKGSYIKKYYYYTEQLRENMLSEQNIVGTMTNALADNQFVVFYQPQYNHSNGMLVGAEALVRWIHPDSGMVNPGLFIPIFEKNGFITSLDLYVFEEACKFIRKCIDNNYSLVPISTNFSRYDIFQPDFVKKLETLREKHQVPVQYIRVEITESAIVGGSQHTNEIVKQLHDCGYIVEMDDFGSGYSSLNVLKDIELDIIKMDMKFLADSEKSKRGGTIISSVVRMAKWLSMPVIAEGVETQEQADFLKSIGCDYIQGYFYSKPLPEEKFLELINGAKVGLTTPEMHVVETLNTFNFWNPDSIETVVFNNFIGGACIFDYNPEIHLAEILRVNEQFIEELGMNLSEKDLINCNPAQMLDEENLKIVQDTLKKAFVTNKLTNCKCWVTVKSKCCGEERLFLDCSFRSIGKSKDSYLFYISIKNITKDISEMNELLAVDHRIRYVADQANIYFWEYSVPTKEMRPCFRCMRDLGLPAVVRNYPEPVIESGIFPADYADMYRDWHKQIANGVKSLEAIIPLTPNRIPFHVRYTTEFDEQGRPVKAFASATLVVDEKK